MTRDTGLLLWRLTRPCGGEAPSKAFLAWSPPLPLPAVALACWLGVKFSDGLGSTTDLRCSKHCFFGERNHTFHDWEVLIITNPSCCHSGSLCTPCWGMTGGGGRGIPLPERLQVCSVLLCVASWVHLWLRPRLPDPCSSCCCCCYRCRCGNTSSNSSWQVAPPSKRAAEAAGP